MQTLDNRHAIDERTQRQPSLDSSSCHFAGGAVDQLGLGVTVDRLGESVIETVTDRPE